MRRALVVLGGTAPSPAFLRRMAQESDFVLCADSGLDACLRAQLRPDAVIGDFDSASPAAVAYMEREALPHIVYPAIKDDTDAIPLYTNFAAGWTMGAWDAYIFGSATGDPEFHNNMPHMASPFADRGDGTGPYAVYYTLYEAVARGLIEDDPMSTDWESSKGRINSGEIATMVLGSWAVQQFKDAGPNPDDISYMPFPITVDGKRYAGAGGNYSYGINNKVSSDNQIAAMLYVKWLLDESSIFIDEGCIPARKDGEMPDFLADFQGVELVSNNPPPEGEEDLFDQVNLQSEVGINNDDYPECALLEAALTGSQTLDEIMAERDAAWNSAQEILGVEVTM